MAGRGPWSTRGVQEGRGWQEGWGQRVHAAVAMELDALGRMRRPEGAWVEQGDLVCLNKCCL